MHFVPGLSVLLAALTAANIGTEDAVFQLETKQATFATVQRYPDGVNLQGYKFTIAARANGELPLWQKSLRSGVFDIYVKAPNGQYAFFAYTSDVNFASDEDPGALLQPGEYFFAAPQWREHVLAVGTWASLETQSRYWSLPYASLIFETVNLQGGGTSTGKCFDVNARPDGSLPYVTSVADLYRRNALGNFELYAAGSRKQYLLSPGRYAFLTSGTPGPAYQYQHVARGVWIAP